jgi:hypothetical protein
MVRPLEDLFPRLRGSQYQITAPRDPTYNCLAWAAGVTDAWWWPSGDPMQVYWPSDAPRAETLDALKAAFSALGYVACDHDAVESGYEKVAFFANAAGTPTHASRQLPGGRWTSKLGPEQVGVGSSGDVDAAPACFTLMRVPAMRGCPLHVPGVFTM